MESIIKLNWLSKHIKKVRNSQPTILVLNWIKHSWVSSRAYLAYHEFDIIWLSETYLNFSNSPDDESLEISGYNLVRPEHPLNSKREGVCIYYKSYLPLQIISVNYLPEWVNFEIMIGNKICNFIALLVRAKMIFKHL